MKLRTERNVHGANFSWQNSLKVNPERTHQQMLSYYDENRIFPIEAILKHKQVVCMTINYFQISLFVPELMKIFANGKRRILSWNFMWCTSKKSRGKIWSKYHFNRPQQQQLFSQINNKTQNQKLFPVLAFGDRFALSSTEFSLVHRVKWQDEVLRQSKGYHINLNKPVFMRTRWSGTLTHDAQLTKLRRRLRLSFSSLAVIMEEK